MGGLSSFTGAISTATKQATGAGSHAVSQATGAVNTAASQVANTEYLGNVAEFAVGALLLGVDPLAGIGMIADSFSGEKDLGEFRDELKEIGKTLTGEYQSDAERVNKAGEAIGVAQDELQKFLDTLDNSFMGEIFAMANANKADVATGSFDQQVAEYEKLLASFQDEYKYMNGMASNDLAKLLVATTRIIGGLVHASGDIVTGKADSGDYKVVIGTLVAVAAIVATGGAATPLAIAAVIAMTISLVLSLDAQFNNGGLMDATMYGLDFILNDILQLKDVAGEFKKFDRDSEYYAEMKGYVQTAVALTAVALSLGSSDPSTLLAQSSTGLPAAYSNLQTLYSTYTSAAAINDIVGQYRALGDLKKELERDRLEIASREYKARSAKMRKAMLDTSSLYTEFEYEVLMYELGTEADPTIIPDPWLQVNSPGADRSRSDSTWDISTININDGMQAGDDTYYSGIMMNM